MSLLETNLVRSVSMTHYNSKATPTNDTDYSCHINVVQLVSQSYGVHILPHYIIYPRGWTHTHTHARTHTLMFCTESILRNQACAGLCLVCTWFANTILQHLLLVTYCMVGSVAGVSLGKSFMICSTKTIQIST